MSLLPPAAGDVWQRKHGRQQSPFVFIVEVTETHAIPCPVVHDRDRGRGHWLRINGRSQAIGFARFTPANYRLIGRDQTLTRREV